MIKSPYKAYRVYIWEPKYSTVIYAKSASQAKSKYYYDGEFSLTFFEAVRQMVVKREKNLDMMCEVLNETLEYVNGRYGKSFTAGQLVVAGGCHGWVLRGQGGYVVVGHGDNRDCHYHPHDVVSCVKTEV